jgi:hypothetical protein
MSTYKGNGAKTSENSLIVLKDEKFIILLATLI